MRFVGIDPATRTGIVALNLKGEVLVEMELKGKGPAGAMSTPQLVDLENQLYKLLLKGDLIVIEDASAGTQKGITTGMVHGGLRSMIYRRELDFDISNAMWTKKYVGVKVEKGQTEKQKKDAIGAAVLEQFGYSHKSHNVVDAYIIARIALNLYLMRNYEPLLDNERHQVEVVQGIMERAEVG
ncbi:hypothetical protein [Paenibacillus sp. NRS-1760]|uniref:hypothetical protein n=1 Tax=Paenibacillus sp. NRS-1760 TaxID=3233902 RepID=UPI003D2CBC5E